MKKRTKKEFNKMLVALLKDKEIITEPNGEKWKKIQTILHCKCQIPMFSNMSNNCAECGGYENAK